MLRQSRWQMSSGYFRLKEGHATGHTIQTVDRGKLGVVIFVKSSQCADYVDGNAGILSNFAGVAIVNLAEGVDSRRTSIMARRLPWTLTNPSNQISPPSNLQAPRNRRDRP